jgi:hypothetical protein
MAKTYDHVEWTYLEKIVLMFGLDPGWFMQIMTQYARSDVHVNLPALHKLNSMLVV